MPTRFKAAFSTKLDSAAGLITLWLLLAYIPLYGLVHIGGITMGEFNTGYLVILLPIWLIDGLKITFETFMRRQYKTSGEDLRKVTVIIACKDGEVVIGNTIRSLLRKFKPDQIIVAVNGSTDRTHEVVREYGVICLDFKEPLGKVRAINAALPHVTTPYVLLLDDDTLIAGANIPTGSLDSGYTAVAFRVLVKLETWVSYLQLHEYRKSFDIGRRYHNKRASVQNISGAIGLFRRDMLIDQVKRHTGEFSGEDLQRTLLIHLAATERGKGGVVLARSTVITQAPTTLKQLFRQRTFGWFPGLYANIFNYIRIMGNRHAPFALKTDAFYGSVLTTLLDVLRILSLPIMIFYPWYFIVTYVAYVFLELVPYLKSGRIEPLWVILLYPLYGVFGLFTRACAGAAFLYRRLTVRLARLDFVDGFRLAPLRSKLVSALFTVVLVATLLLLNIAGSYSSIFTSIELP